MIPFRLRSHNILSPGKQFPGLSLSLILFLPFVQFQNAQRYAAVVPDIGIFQAAPKNILKFLDPVKDGIPVCVHQSGCLRGRSIVVQIALQSLQQFITGSPLIPQRNNAGKAGAHTVVQGCRIHHEVQSIIEESVDVCFRLMKTAVGDGRLGLSIQVIRVFQILRGETESYFDRVLLRQTAEKFQYISILFQISIRENQDIGVSLHYNTVHRPLANGLNKKIQVILLLNLCVLCKNFCQCELIGVFRTPFQVVQLCLQNLFVLKLSEEQVQKYIICATVILNQGSTLSLIHI